MKSLPIIFLGIFFTLAFSWTGVVLINHLQLKELQPVTPELVNDQETPIGGLFYTDETTGERKMGQNQSGMTTYPQPMTGAEKRGKQVYEQMGCLYCHSQQVRRQGFGSDFERGWGKRQSVARDYIMHDRVMLGTMRTGPDLANVGDRYTELWQYQHLYNPQITSPGSTMPPFPFLFDKQEISDMRGPSGEAIPLPEGFELPEGYELVPTQRARDLVAYLLGLRQAYELPEKKFSE